MTEKHVFEKLMHLVNEKSIAFDMNDSSSYKPVLAKIHDARMVLIGEATHGTHEFYQTRAEISKKLITEKGFKAIAIEADWPDAYCMNRYVKGAGSKEDVEVAFKGFSHFPTWMWKNQTIVPFLLWLREYNDKIENFNQKVGIYGLDLYSLHASMRAVIEYLQKVDPKAAKRAQDRYACFDHLSFDPETYGYLTSTGVKESCVKKAVEQLFEIQSNALEYLRQDGVSAEDEYFYATQNARLVKNAEKYYRAQFEGRVSSWNIRDSHMAETFNIISNHIEKCTNKTSKLIVWAHNSHVGDARATEMGEQGEVNIGQLIREQHGEEAYLIGFSTYEGYVTAASAWGGAAKHKRINPGLHGSYEDLFHHTEHDNFVLNFRHDKELEHFLHIYRLQRAIGVVYRPDTERYSHYFFTNLPYQFDTMIHIDKTTAVQPLDLNEKSD